MTTCALRIALEFSEGKQRLIKSILSISNQELDGKFPYHVCMDQTGAENALTNAAFLQSSISNPYIMICLVGIGKCCPDRLLGFSWVIDTPDQLIKDRKSSELVLRIVGLLSVVP